MSKPPKNWRPFEEAREWVRSQHFENSSDYIGAWKRREIPLDIPSNPNLVYAGRGWAGMPNFLGSEVIYWSYKKASKWARGQKKNGAIFTSKEWASLRKAGQIPKEIPGSPDRTYANSGWTNWGDFLEKNDSRRSNIERIIAVEVGRFCEVLEGHVRIVLPDGRKKKADLVLPQTSTVIEYDGCYFHRYSQAKDIRETLAMEQVGYQVIRIREHSKQYSLELINPANDIRLPATMKAGEKVFQILLHLLNLGIIDSTHRAAIENGRGDFLNRWAKGSFSSAKFVTYDRARQIARKLNLRNKREWHEFAASSAFQTAKFADMPVSPPVAYGREFLGWGDFLGTGNISNKNKVFLDYQASKELIALLQPRIDSETKLRAALRIGLIPDTIPKNAPVFYAKKGWTGWGDFLGTGNQFHARKDYISFAEAKDYVKENLKDVTTEVRWNAAVQGRRVPASIPKRPAHTYRDRGWTNWGDFLGTARAKHQPKPFLSYCAAKDYLRKHHSDIKSGEGFQRARTAGILPSTIPSNPSVAYRDRGWIDGYDFFAKPAPASRRSVSAVT